MTSRTSSHDLSDSRGSTHASPYQNAALQGAALAFAKPVPTPKPGRQTAINGALAAATKAGNSSSLSPPRSAAKDAHLVSQYNGGSSSPGTSVGGGLELAPFRERLYQHRKADSTDYLILPSPTSDRSVSPSHIAATLAASRSAPISPNNTGSKPARPPGLHRKRSSSGRSTGRSISRSRDVLHDALDTTSIPPTTSLIGLFERSAETAPSLKGANIPAAALNTKKLGAMPPSQFRAPVIAAKPDPVKSPKPVMLSPKRDLIRDDSRPSSEKPGFSLDDGEGSDSDDSFVSASDNRPQSPLSRTPRPLSISSESRAIDSLATAIVASSLASSRAASPSKSSANLAPPVPPARRSNTSLFHHHHHNIQDSRTPSPAKGLRQTMRKPPKDDEDEGLNVLRRGRTNIMKKHPNKHHEGDRKRWRDSITERERKRYEAVWASNKGLHIPITNASGNFLPPPSGPSAAGPLLPNPTDAVSNVVVRDIWARSRLGPDVLSEVWELVDRSGSGVLSKEEFVVGLWLVDQRLKGRKLPIRVGDSVWSSIAALGGVRVRSGGRKR